MMYKTPNNNIISSTMFALIILIALKATTTQADVLVYSRIGNQVSCMNMYLHKRKVKLYFVASLSIFPHIFIRSIQFKNSKEND